MAFDLPLVGDVVTWRWIRSERGEESEDLCDEMDDDSCSIDCVEKDSALFFRTMFEDSGEEMADLKTAPDGWKCPILLVSVSLAGSCWCWFVG